MAYNSAHTGPEIDAAVQLLGQIQDARDGTSQDLIEVKGLSSQVKSDAIQVSSDAQTVAEKAAQVASSSAAVEQARVQVVSATEAAEEAMGEAALSANSAQESQAAASVSEHAAAQSQLAAGLSEQVSAEHAAEATQAANQVAADRVAAQASAESAATSARNAEAVVTGGTASVTPNPGLIPLADSAGKIDADWLPESIARAGEVQAAADAAAEAVDTAAEAQSRTERFLLPSPEAPVVRDDGSPLQVGDRYFNAVDQVELIYADDGWRPNDSLQAIAALGSSLQDSFDPNKGASPLGFDGGSLGRILEHSQVVYDYTELRSYTGRAKKIYVTKEGIEGHFRSRGKSPGFADTNGTYIISNDGTVWERLYTGPTSVLWFDCPLDGVTPCDAAFASWAATLKTGFGLIPPIKYNVSNFTLKLVGHSPVVGGLKIEASGASIVGECAIVIDSCKRVRIVGLEGFRTDFHLNGAWFFNAKDCKYRFAIMGSSPGSVFSDNYWGKFEGGQCQGAYNHENNAGPSNKLTWDSVCFRGNAQQGFATTQEYALRFYGKKNCQGWAFKGCDMSYYANQMIDIGPDVVSDIEILFDDPYFDTLFPSIPSRPNTRLVINNAHAENDMPNSASIAQVARGSQEAWRGDRAAGWKSFTGHNLIPNGDLYDVLPKYDGAGLPSGSANAAIITLSSGGINGRYLNINQAKTSSNSVVFRSKPAPMKARYTSVLVVRNADPAPKKVRVSVAGLFFYATVGSSEWSILNLTTGIDVPVGTVIDTIVLTDDGTPFNIDVCYAGTFVGESVPLFLPAPRHQSIDAVLTVGGVATLWNPPNLVAGAQVTQDVITPGASLGDFARASFSLPLQGLTLSASVSAPDTVQVVLRNGTSSSIDLAAGTLRVRVDKAGY